MKNSTQGRKQKTDQYSAVEEQVNIVSHAAGILLGTLILMLLLVKALPDRDPLSIISYSMFGAGMITLYTASTLYHASRPDSVRRNRLKVFDHAAIYVLIAGTYTPFALITLQGTIGWLIFAITWTAAVAGIILKLFFVHRFRTVSTIMYVLMGWLIVFFIRPVMRELPSAGLIWLVAGGAAYTFGAVLYLIKRIPANHALFHLLVLVGSVCHSIAIYRYV